MVSKFGSLFSAVLPFFVLGGPVPLPPILEPVRNLRRRQAGRFGQLAFLPRRRVSVGHVPLAQRRARLLLEAVGRLLAVPDRPGQRVLPTDSVFADSA